MDLMEVFKHLTDEEREEYRALEQTMASPGWGRIAKLAEEMKEYYERQAAYAQNWEANRMAIGAAGVYQWVSTLREATEAEFAAKAQERLDDQQISAAEGSGWLEDYE